MGGQVRRPSPASALANAYDMVCNGYEIGGGSIRIHQQQMQQQVFDVSACHRRRRRSQFGFLLEAFKYGPPPHGGIAFGWDRVVMLLAGAPTRSATSSPSRRPPPAPTR